VAPSFFVSRQSDELMIIHRSNFATLPFRAFALSLCSLSLCSILWCVPSPAGATEPDAGGNKPAETPDENVLEGHSYHGESFNEGPRQAAVLIENMGNVEFPSSAKDELAQKFINQGVAALHGFWYLEAERSFRQAAKIEPNLAIAYWGMALANMNNKDRAVGLIKEAVDRRDTASKQEQLYIDAFSEYLKKPESEESKEQKEEREKRLIRNLEKILDEYPDDVEAKALLALRMWEGTRNGLQITSNYAVDAVLGQVFDANPLHPAHHYRIHLWDSPRPENAVHSAGMCGPAIPAIAHMWHMPGHIYSRLHRYADAAWQQEASARVDHAHMIRTRLLPDQIHNFAHNNEWLTRNLIFLGRFNDALVQSRNLTAMPQHPKYNSMTKRGSYRYGRLRLVQTLTEFEAWPQLIEESKTAYWQPTEDEGWQNERLAWVAVAHHLLGQKEEAQQLDWELRERLIALDTQQIEIEKQLHTLSKEPAEEKKPEDKACEDSDTNDDEEETDEAESSDAPTDKKSVERKLSRLKSNIRELKEYIALQKAAAAVAAKDVKTFKQHLEQAGRVEKTLAASWLSQAGDHNAAIEDLKKLVNDSPGQVRPLAVLARALWLADNKEEAVKRFEELRTLAAFADLETPLLANLTELAKHAGHEGDWRIPYQSPDDLGERPELDSLGPFSWSPYPAPSWKAINGSGEDVTDDTYQGGARLVIFYLGFGCLHCVEQLDKFKPMVEQFREAGIEIVGISNESSEDYQKGITRYDEDVPFTLLANPDVQAFHDYRCWDDFEDQPLHGTFLIDAKGQVRWQDIGHEPFTDAKFLLNESKRLLSIEN
jgi:peroxiredoxin